MMANNNIMKSIMNYKKWLKTIKIKMNKNKIKIT